MLSKYLEEDHVLFPEENETSVFARVRVLGIVVGTVTSLLSAGILFKVLVLLRFARALQRRVLIHLAALIFSCVVAQVYTLILFGTPLSWSACSWLGSFLPIVYSLANFLGFRVVLLRAYLVAQQMSANFATFLQRVMLTVTWMWLLSFLGILFMKGVLVFEERRCALSAGKGVLLGITIGTLVTTVFILAIYSYPLYLCAQRISQTFAQSGHTLRLAARRNLQWISVVIVWRTFFAVIIAFTASSHAPTDIEEQQVRLYGWLGGMIDAAITTLVNVVLFRKLLQRESEKSKVQPRLRASNSSSKHAEPSE